MIKSIKKILTSNDTGSSGSHQAGIHFPKGNNFLTFFPTLSATLSNPRENIIFIDENDMRWKFVYIHYNNKRVVSNVSGKFGTRDEFRLTHMTKYFRSKGLVPGDSITFSRDSAGNYRIDFNRSNPETIVASESIWEVEFVDN